MGKHAGKLKFAIIGCGVIGPKHAEGIAACNNAELYAVCDIIREKAELLAKKYNAKMVFTDYKEMLQQKEIDIVCICTPSGLHGDMAIACAEMGKHVLCEKPLDISTDKINAMIKACRDHNVKLGGIFQNRTYSGCIAAKKILDEGKLGKIYIADGYTKEYRSPAYYKSAGWRGTWALDGGGCLINQGVHCIDILCWLAGPVESILARTYTMARDIEVEDSAFALVRFKNGACGVIEGSTISLPGRDDYVEIQCEKGRILYDSGKTVMYETDSGGNVIETPLDTEEIDKSNTANDPSAFTAKGHTYLIADMARAVTEDREPYITGASARNAVDAILAIYESSRTWKEIYL